MKEILKDTYLLPECRVMEVKLQGMIAISGGGYPENEEEILP